MKKYFLILLIVSYSVILTAQLKTPGEKRFSFAEGVIGFDFQYMPQGGQSYFINPNEEITSFNLPYQLTPRFHISGLHFWGHADFYIILPIVNVLPQSKDLPKTYYSTGPETGIKIYPWALRENTIRPYTGISWNIVLFNQSIGDHKGTTLVRNQAPLHLGVSYHSGKNIIDIGASYNYQGKQNYYLNRDLASDIELNPISFAFSYKWTFDSSLKDAKEYDNGIISRQIDYLRSIKKLSGFSISVGLSSSLITNSKYNKQNNPFSEDMKISNSHLDLGLGYYFEEWDAHINASFRNIPYEVTSYDFKQKMTRNSFGIEIYKFLFDYHGFVPYIGLIPSRERVRFEEINNGNKTLSETENNWRMGLIFGWDIRQDERQWYILRTNLRYFPMSMNLNGQNYAMNQFEFNFIQFVYYPSRHKWIKKARKEIY